jgi:hypothetical protein
VAQQQAAQQEVQPPAVSMHPTMCPICSTVLVYDGRMVTMWGAFDNYHCMMNNHPIRI